MQAVWCYYANIYKLNLRCCNGQIWSPFKKVRVIQEITPTGSFNVRGIFMHESGNLSLEGKHSSFSIIAHNLGLMVAPGIYLGTDRSGAIAEVIQRIKITNPDVVCLCEVFADGEREKIISELSDYKYFREGPDKSPSFFQTVAC